MAELDFRSSGETSRGSHRRVALASSTVRRRPTRLRVKFGLGECPEITVFYGNGKSKEPPDRFELSTYALRMRRSAN
jgi:hypothetical protein